ncbi:MAG TPA: hypothetical protein VEO91_11080, partial [Candidatus Limnocylindria bacterium]|nr:hypothetical protein [Candidatus Limnocylindria bacterium]
MVIDEYIVRREGEARSGEPGEVLVQRQRLGAPVVLTREWVAATNVDGDSLSQKGADGFEVTVLDRPVEAAEKLLVRMYRRHGLGGWSCAWM